MPKDDAQSHLESGVFPLDAKRERPLILGTADCGKIVTAVDSCNYAIKDMVSGDSVECVPHCEWFCTQLGERINIPGPTGKIIRMLDGTLVFGSRWLGGVVSPSNGGEWWQRELNLADVQMALSAIYAFDQFIHNVDRHNHNFIVHEQHSDFAIIAMDYSRAWLSEGFPLPPPPLPDFCNTVVEQRELTKLWGGRYIDPEVVDRTLDRIGKVKDHGVRRIIEDHPRHWLPDRQKSEILTWWGSPSMNDRLTAISEGVRNGTYL